MSNDGDTKFSLTFENRKSYVQSESVKSSIDNPLKIISIAISYILNIVPNDRSDSTPLYKEDCLSESSSDNDYLEDDSLPCPFSADDLDCEGNGEAKLDLNVESPVEEEREELPITPSRPRTPPRLSSRRRPNYRVESPSLNSPYHLKFTPTMSHRKLVDLQRSGSGQSLSPAPSTNRLNSIFVTDKGVLELPMRRDVDSPFTIHTKRSLSCSAEDYAKYMMPITMEELKQCEDQLDQDMKDEEEEEKKRKREDEKKEVLINNNVYMSNYDERGRRIPFPIKDGSTETLREYILNPLPSNTSILKCCITRNKHFNGNVYHVSLDYPNDHTYLLSCKKKLSSKTSYYSLSMSEYDFIEPHYHLGKIRLHQNPTYYSIYSNGKNPNKTKHKELIRDEMGIVFYNCPHDNPPDIFAVLPKLINNKSEKIKDSNSGTLYTRICNMHYNDFIILRSKKPVWSPEKHGHIMSFGGRVTMASTKNFQLLETPYGNETVLQFGRTDSNSFIFDLKHPLSIYQGLSIIMSVIDQGIDDKNTDALVDKLAGIYPAPTHL